MIWRPFTNVPFELRLSSSAEVAPVAHQDGVGSRHPVLVEPDVASGPRPIGVMLSSSGNRRVLEAVIEGQVVATPRERRADRAAAVVVVQQRQRVDGNVGGDAARAARSDGRGWGRCGRSDRLGLGGGLGWGVGGHGGQATSCSRARAQAALRDLEDVGLRSGLDASLERRDPAVPPSRGPGRGAARTSRRPAVGQARRWRVVDPEGRVRRLTRSRSSPPGGSSPRSSGPSRPTARRRIWGRSARAAGSWCVPGRSRATSTPARSSATRSNSSGRRGRGGRSRRPRWTVRSGSRWRRRGRRSTPPGRVLDRLARASADAAR